MFTAHTSRGFEGVKATTLYFAQQNNLGSDSCSSWEGQTDAKPNETAPGEQRNDAKRAKLRNITRRIAR
ncbi:hypothetical protein HMPREF0183_0284, partial [Brevibacterium mcbrellneri ATCC 49030]